MSNGFTNPQSRIRSVLSAILLTLFVSVLVGSISPQLHKVVHSEAGKADHSCAITLLSSGDGVTINNDAVITGFNACCVDSGFVNDQSVLSTFLSGSAFEHAPPAQV
jgi:hypothetical protein